jgi:hypothetical protein
MNNDFIHLILDHVFKLFLILRRSIVGDPVGANGEFMKSKHVTHAHVSDGGVKQVGPLIDASRDQKTTIGTATNGQLFFTCVLVIY